MSSFSAGSVDDKGDLLWGMLGEGADVVLCIDDIHRLVAVVGDEIKRRALSIPLLFSSLALDVKVPKVRSLIRAFLLTLTPPMTLRSRSTTTKEEVAWRQEVAFAGEREIAWVYRWGLSRAMSVRNNDATGKVDEKRGFVELDVYYHWRENERALNYPSSHFNAFTLRCPMEIQALLEELFQTFSRLISNSSKNGCSLPNISALFGPIIFGLPINSSIINTHQAFTKSCLALEHLLYSYIRLQQAVTFTSAGELPGILSRLIKGYPAMLPSDNTLTSGKPRRGQRTIRGELTRRDVRGYSKELWRSAEYWAGDLETASNGAMVWQTWYSRVIIPSAKNTVSKPLSGPKYSADWRKRMQAPSHLPPLKEGLHGMGRSEAVAEGEDNEDDREHWASLTEMKWDRFMEGGFDVSKGSSISKKLEFDLTEGLRSSQSQKRNPLEWNDFEADGFSRGDAPLAATLDFSPPVIKEVHDWPGNKEDLHRRLKKVQKDLPAFQFDIKPRVEGVLILEEAFMDCWADLLVSGGWMDRDEPTFREGNFAVVQYKAVPAESRTTPLEPNEDPRTEDLYCFFEEVVPLTYQDQLSSPKKKPRATLFSSKSKRVALDDTTRSSKSREKEEAFENSLRRGATQKLQLSTTITPNRTVFSPTSPLSPPQKVKVSLPPTPAFKPQPFTLPSTPLKKTATPHVLPAGSKSENSKHEKEKAGFFARKLKMKDQPSQRFNFDTSEVRENSSSEDGSPNRPNVSRSGSKDDMWIDILISNGAKSMTVDKSAAPALASKQSSRSLTDQLPSKEIITEVPPVPSKDTIHLSALSENSLPIALSPSKFQEGASSEVDPLSTRSTKTVQAPHTPPYTPPDNRDEELEPVVDEVEETPEVRSPVPVPQIALTRNSVASEVSQDSSLDNDIPLSESLAPVDPPRVETSSPRYQHGQPLHNLPEDEEEEDL